MLRFALSYDGPIALRYPRGSAYDEYEEFREPIMLGKSEMIYEESEIAVVSVGHMFEDAVKVREQLKMAGYSCTLVNARFVKPIDEEMIRKLGKNHRLIATIEENVQTGGYGEHVLEYVSRENLNVKVLPLALPDDYIEHGSIEVLRKETGIDVKTMTRRIQELYDKM